MGRQCCGYPSCHLLNLSLDAGFVHRPCRLVLTATTVTVSLCLFSPHHRCHVVITITIHHSQDHGVAFVTEAGIAADRHKLFNGKQLSMSATSSYRLTAPFLAWGVIVVLLYGLSYRSFGKEGQGIIGLKLSERSLVQTSRVTYFAARTALEPVRLCELRVVELLIERVPCKPTLCCAAYWGIPNILTAALSFSMTGTISATATLPPPTHSSAVEQDVAERAAQQPQLRSEAVLLDDVFSAFLYGGDTLPDSVATGAKDAGSGSLFSSPT